MKYSPLYSLATRLFRPASTTFRQRRLNAMLADRFHISHTTVQFEHVSCAISENGCAIPVHIDDHEGHRH